MTVHEGDVIAHALLTRCLVGGESALALAPCAVLPRHRRQGAGAAAIRAALEAARNRGENLVVVLSHAGYFPRFGFTPASRRGVHAPFDVPDDAFLALSLDASRPTPTGVITHRGPWNPVRLHHARVDVEKARRTGGETLDGMTTHRANLRGIGHLGR